MSGSSSVELEKESISVLTGRYFLYNINPLSFTEFLELKKSKIDMKKSSLWKGEIKKEFKEYLKKPFPEIIEWKSDILIKEYLKESIIDKIIRSDLTSKFKDINKDLLQRLIEIVYSNPGMYINYDSLSSDLKVSKKTLINHIYYLEFAYLIRKIKNLRPNILTVSKKMQRLYPYHWALVFPISETNIYESFVASILDAKYYWREKEKEVDFILKDKTLIPIEVKSEKVTKDDFKSMIYLCKKNNLTKAYVLCSDKEETKRAENITIKIIPFWKLALKGLS